MIDFAFLVLEEHPYGREMLQHLLKKNFIPSLIVQEVSTVGDEEREKFLTRISGQPIPPTIDDLIADKAIPVKNVDNHNNEKCRELLCNASPDLVVLGGTRIMRKPIIEIPKRGMINAHPGLLPWLRGSASVGWALYLDMEIGSTVHYINPGIDTGDIILREALPVTRDDSYESLNQRVAKLSGRLMSEVLGTFVTSGEVIGTPQDESAGTTYRVIPEDLLKEGIDKLITGRYKHYSK